MNTDVGKGDRVLEYRRAERSQRCNKAKAMYLIFTVCLKYDLPSNCPYTVLYICEVKSRTLQYFKDDHVGIGLCASIKRPQTTRPPADARAYSEVVEICRINETRNNFETRLTWLRHETNV